MIHGLKNYFLKNVIVVRRFRKCSNNFKSVTSLGLSRIPSFGLRSFWEKYLKLRGADNAKTKHSNFDLEVNGRSLEVFGSALDNLHLMFVILTQNTNKGKLLFFNYVSYMNCYLYDCLFSVWLCQQSLTNCKCSSVVLSVLFYSQDETIRTNTCINSTDSAIL